MPNPVFFIYGIPELKKALLDIARAVPKVVADALYEEAKIEMKEAKKRTPVSEKGSDGMPPGTLRNSGDIVKWDGKDPEDIRVILTFGVPIPHYAVYVHEDLEAFHKVGQAKFLESTLLESASHIEDRVARRIHMNRWAGKK